MRNFLVKIGGRTVKARPSISAILIYRQAFDCSLLDDLRTALNGKEGDMMYPLRIFWALAVNADEEGTPDFMDFIEGLLLGGGFPAGLYRLLAEAGKALLDVPRRPLAGTGEKGKKARRESSACPDLQVLALASAMNLGLAEWRDLRTSDVVDMMIDTNGLDFEREGDAQDMAAALDTYVF
jgi:hypothetical protein